MDNMRISISTVAYAKAKLIHVYFESLTHEYFWIFSKKSLKIDLTAFEKGYFTPILVS